MAEEHGCTEKDDMDYEGGGGKVKASWFGERRENLLNRED